ncbi:glycosyltransferase [Methanolobus sp.]|uniref:glycosyltransferase family 2 protein n=1 Tax=Methanolobus sp. TaxID=1874737 RepID=UPI0025FA61B9|nr:glycosyltransferase [Methanolobus sp.]
MCKHEEVMVSICCATYNHENYIADAIEGFLMQETNFKYEILIHDDASTDKTAEIIRTYEQKYPDIIKPIYQKVNQYSQGVKVTPTFNYPRAKGKYIAICEGDDYWTDSKKLQIQFDCLERNQNVVCCYHSDYILDKNGLRKESRLSLQDQRSYTSYEMMACQTHILPLTAFFRNLDVLQNYPPEAKYVKNGDTFLFSILGQYGSGMYLQVIEPAIYRAHEGGIWSMKSEREHKVMQMNTWYWLAEYYSRLGNPRLQEKFKIRCLSVVVSDLNRLQLLSMSIKMCLPLRLVKIIKKIQLCRKPISY